MPTHPDFNKEIDRHHNLRRLQVMARICVIVLLTICCEFAFADSTLPVLTSCHAAHHLTSAEANRHYPVRLTATVTYFEVEGDKADPTLFVLDHSGSVYVALVSAPAVPLVPGDLVEISGFTTGGQYAPIVTRATARLIGHSGLPHFAPRVGIGQMLSGEQDGQWVEIEAVVHAARIKDGVAVLTLSMKGGMIAASTPIEPNFDYNSLVDARIILHGNAAPLFNHQQQVTGGVIIFPGMATLRVEQPPPSRPFALPVSPIIDLLRYIPDPGIRHRVHVRGYVTLFWPGRMLCLHDETDSVCAQVDQAEAVLPGDQVDVIGFPSAGEFSPSLANATYLARGLRQAVLPQFLKPHQALNDESDGELVSIEGQVIGEDAGVADPTVILSAEDMVFTAMLAKNLSAHLKVPEPGSRVRLTGICSIQSGGPGDYTREGFPVAKSFRLLLPSPSDLVVLQKPSWWNAVHTLCVLALALVFALVALLRVVLLSRRIRQQTEVIRAQLLESAALKDAAEIATLAAQHHAAHDELTGIRNRRTIFADFQREYDAAICSGSTLGVIMVDLDHFKRVNDTYGHLAGDEVLRETVRRITVAVRASDLVGRYGGEEFIILMPRCDKSQLQLCAERIRVAIACEPMLVGETAIKMTTSVGTTVTMSPAYAMLDALAAADEALYQAKNSGRNRVVLKDPATGRFEQVLSSAA